MILSDDQIATFLKDGVLVVDNLLSDTQLNDCLNGLKKTLASHSVNIDDLESTGQFLIPLSSTNGSGGVLDISYYDDWKIRDISTNPSLLFMTQQLWKAAYLPSKNENSSKITSEDWDVRNDVKYHPYGNFDCNRGYLYIDRIGYRLPTDLAETIGSNYSAKSIKSAKKRKSVAIQRSLTPHLDCCPETFFSTKGKKKWRPIQCFVSLVDTTEPNHGGFEAAKGFHLLFDKWAKNRQPTATSKTDKVDNTLQPTLCVGEYTHIRPKEDELAMKMIQHIPVTAGAAVFWDERIPHSNAYRHVGLHPRVVAYCSFLPDVEINREYVKEQLWKWIQLMPPTDQWINLESHNLYKNNEETTGKPNLSVANSNNKKILEFDIERKLTPLGCQLAGLHPWK